MNKEEMGSYRACTLWRSVGKLIYPWVMEIRGHAKEILLSLRFSCLSQIHGAAVVMVRLQKLSMACLWVCPIPAAFSGSYVPG